jgi:hypothetical protein
VYKVEQLGNAACHTGHRTCFFRRVDNGELVVEGEKVAEFNDYVTRLKNGEDLRGEGYASAYEEFLEGRLIKIETGEIDLFAGITDDDGNEHRASTINEVMQGLGLVPYFNDKADVLNFFENAQWVSEEIDELFEIKAQVESQTGGKFFVICDLMIFGESETIPYDAYANQYLGFFPYIDRLWFGEAFNYDESPDFWLVEVSGIPYGLMGDMLQSGGNRWRGMIYGMTARRPWIFNSDPRPMWKFWDEFGIEDARMIGYWRDDCPVTTDVNNILATAYVKNDKTLISVASWNPDSAKCHLKIDWKKLGLDKNKSQLYAPAIRNFQQEMVFKTDDPIPVLPGKGWLFIIDNKKN